MVGRPEGVRSDCFYDVRFPDTVAATAEVLVRISAEFAIIGSAALETSATYASVFSPEIDIATPSIDVDGDSRHDSAGMTLTVQYRTLSQNSDICTHRAEEVWQVDGDGVVTRQSPAAVLVNYSQTKQNHCVYRVLFPEFIPAATRVLERPQDKVYVTVGGDATSAAITYEHSPITFFFPELRISVPDIDADEDARNDFLGTAIRVAYTPVVEFPSRVLQTSQRQLASA